MGVVLPSENGAGGTGSKEVGEPGAGDHSDVAAGTSCSHLVFLPYNSFKCFTSITQNSIY